MGASPCQLRSFRFESALGLQPRGRSLFASGSSSVLHYESMLVSRGDLLSAVNRSVAAIATMTSAAPAARSARRDFDLAMAEAA